MCGSRHHRLSTLRFIPEGNKVLRVLILLLSRILHRQESWLETRSITMTVMSARECVPWLKWATTGEFSVLVTVAESSFGSPYSFLNKHKYFNKWNMYSFIIIIHWCFGEWKSFEVSWSTITSYRLTKHDGLLLYCTKKDSIQYLQLWLCLYWKNCQNWSFPKKRTPFPTSSHQAMDVDTFLKVLKVINKPE